MTELLIFERCVVVFLHKSPVGRVVGRDLFGFRRRALDLIAPRYYQSLCVIIVLHDLRPYLVMLDGLIWNGLLILGFLLVAYYVADECLQRLEPHPQK